MGLTRAMIVRGAAIAATAETSASEAAADVAIILIGSCYSLARFRYTYEGKAKISQSDHFICGKFLAA